MARLMSFAMTEAAVRARRKTVTRRLGWQYLKPGEELRAVRKVMGRKPGEPIVDLARIRVVSVRREKIGRITQIEVAREGYPDLPRREFIEKFCAAMDCSPSTAVTRIEFEYVD